MRCDYFDSGRCRSCTLIETPHARQVAAKQAELEALVGAAAPSARTDWREPLVSADR